MSNTHLIIPDSHAHPDFHNDRFKWLGELIYDIRPDVVINIGDLADMASLCFHSKKIELEKARYKADCDVAIDAQEKLFHKFRQQKRKLPRMVWTLGNHDIRPQRWVDNNPEFEGVIKNEDIGFNDFPWHEVYPFLEPVEIDGVAYSHYFTSGIMGRPIGGVHPAHSMVSKYHKSMTAGHSHVFDYKVHKTPGANIAGLSVGCYVDYDAPYAGLLGNEMWSRGVVVKRNVKDGVYDLQWISLDAIKKEYNKR